MAAAAKDFIRRKIAPNFYDFVSSEPNYDGFVVIGAGLPRTGTLSLHAALSILLDGPCYHGYSLVNAKTTDPDLRHWSKAKDYM